MDNLLYLIYINKVGKDYKGNHIYEFIFSDTKEKIDGEDWDATPASGRPKPPNANFIKSVGRLESELELDVIQDSNTFAVWDAIDDVISLGWEIIDHYDTYPDIRLSFKFGITMDEVEGKLYSKDLRLQYNKKHEKH